MGKLRNFEKVAEIRSKIEKIEDSINALLNALEKAADKEKEKEVNALCGKIDSLHSEAYSIFRRCRSQRDSAIIDMRYINCSYDMTKYYSECAYDYCDDVYRTKYLDY